MQHIDPRKTKAGQAKAMKAELERRREAEKRKKPRPHDKARYRVPIRSVED